MSFWFLVQTLVNLILFAGVLGVWIRLHRPQKDDPRLSKGLQLLQSKIAILEDLSDRTEVQVSQLTALLEQKCKDIQIKIQSAEKQVSAIDQSMQKSLEVAKIFQDRIPHTEILERQSTIKYVKAARLAHQGLSVDEIAQQVDLSRGEIDFISKVNKDQLMFCEDSLPEWIENKTLDANVHSTMETMTANQQNTFEPSMPYLKEASRDLSSVFEMPSNDQNALKKLGEAFKAAVEKNKFSESTNAAQPQAQIKDQNLTAKTVQELTKVNSKNDVPKIRPVEFRRIDMNRDLG